MRLRRERSHGDLERGHSMCLEFTGTEEQCEAFSKIARQDERFSFGSFNDECEDGWSSCIIIDQNDEDDLRAIYKQFKQSAKRSR